MIDEPIRDGTTVDVGEGHDLELPKEISDRETPATAETLDRRAVQDRTGLLMQAGARPRGDSRAVLDPRVHRNGGILVCTQCKIELFRVFCSSVGPYLQIICANEECGAMYPVLEMTPVQMNSALAVSHNLYVPDHLKNTGSLAQPNRAQRRMNNRRR